MFDLQETPDHVIARIRKLMALEGSPNEFEAAAATAAVQRQLTAYRLTRDEVAARDILTVPYPVLEQPGEGWRTLLLSVIAEAFACRVVVVNKTPLIIGTVLDTKATVLTFQATEPVLTRRTQEAWVAHVADLTDPELGRHPSLDEPDVERDWTRSFQIGMVQAVADHVVHGRVTPKGPADTRQMLQLVGSSRGTQLKAIDTWVTAKFGARLQTVEPDGEDLIILPGAVRTGRKAH